MSGRVRFGVYELHSDTLDLRKNGVPISLQEQPLQVLAALVQRPGEIVTREQLQQRIWGNNTFVDFDQSLNKAVNRLREALHDDPAQPHYIETVPRRGYRFVAPVIEIFTKTDSEGGEARPHATNQTLSHTRSFPSVRLAKAAPVLGAAMLIFIAITLLWPNHQKKGTGMNTRHLAARAFTPTLTKDAKLIAYDSLSDDNVPHIWLQQTSGGDAIQITNGPDADLVSDFSPDGTLIAFYSDRAGGGVYTVSALPREQPRLIVKTSSYVRPRFSPDGSRLLYCVDSQIFTVAADGGQPLGSKLNDKYRVDNALWSPSGKEIVFHGVNRSDAEEKSQWWIAPIASGEARAANLPELNGADFRAIRSWMVTPDGKRWIVYRAIDDHDSWKIVRVQVTSQGQAHSRPEIIASGTGSLDSFSISANGQLAYSIQEQKYQIYEIPLNNHGQKSGPTSQLTLGTGGDYLAPSISHDGEWLAYNATRPGTPSGIFLRNSRTGMERLLDDKGHRPHATGDAATAIAPDASRVAFERVCNPERKWFPGNLLPDCTFTVSFKNGQVKQLCDLCIPRGFSTDGAILLVQKMERTTLGKGQDSIFLIDVTSGSQKEFLSLPDADLYDAYFSWDDAWVVFKRLLGNSKSKILIASVQNRVAADPSRWIEVSDGRFSDDKPRFSPDGDIVYFTSTRDGYLCIWGQRLDPITKRPLGTAFPVEHFHSSQGRDGDQAASDLSITRHRMIINLPEIDSDLWITQADTLVDRFR